jgi:methylase of polypeptide subunit release factors
MGLHFTVPEGYLIPTICSRFEFLKFILKELKPKVVLEIGTGASSILALMMGYLGIKVTATEIDKEAYQCAKNNVENNHLASMVNLVKSEGQIIQKLIPDLSIYDLIICNPPQYDKKYYQERYSSNRGFTGKYSELVGGEIGHEFILDLISEASQYSYCPPIYFQLTKPKLQDILESGLKEKAYNYFKSQVKVGTRLRIYYKVKIS